MTFDINFVRGIVTVLWFALFVGIWSAAWSRKRKGDFAAAARLPLEPLDATSPAAKEPADVQSH